MRSERCTSGDARVFAVLCSWIHAEWSLAAGGRLGIGHDPRYGKGRCFDAFPFPPVFASRHLNLSRIARRVDAHRKAAIARDERVTMTGMYNVVEKLRSGEPLTPKERTIHEIAACGVLRDIHDELDALVAEAYDWPWPMEKEEILERLAALHDERVAEEKRGVIRWLRPDYQIPRFAPEPARGSVVTEEAAVTDSESREIKPWPATAVDQLRAIGDMVSQRPVTPDEVVTELDGARRDLIVRHLETLALMGEVTVDAAGRYQAAKKVA